MRAIIILAAILPLICGGQSMKEVPLVVDTTGKTIIMGGYFLPETKMIKTDNEIILYYVEATTIPSANAVLNQRTMIVRVGKDVAPDFFNELGTLYDKYAVPLIKDTISARGTVWRDLILVQPQEDKK